MSSPSLSGWAGSMQNTPLMQPHTITTRNNHAFNHNNTTISNFNSNTTSFNNNSSFLPPLASHSSVSSTVPSLGASSHAHANDASLTLSSLSIMNETDDMESGDPSSPLSQLLSHVLPSRTSDPKHGHASFPSTPLKSSPLQSYHTLASFNPASTLISPTNQFQSPFTNSSHRSSLNSSPLPSDSSSSSSPSPSPSSQHAETFSTFQVKTTFDLFNSLTETDPLEGIDDAETPVDILYYYQLHSQTRDMIVSQCVIALKFAYALWSQLNKHAMQQKRETKQRTIMRHGGSQYLVLSNSDEKRSHDSLDDVSHSYIAEHDDELQHHDDADASLQQAQAHAATASLSSSTQQATTQHDNIAPPPSIQHDTHTDNTAAAAVGAGGDASLSTAASSATSSSTNLRRVEKEQKEKELTHALFLASEIKQQKEREIAEENKRLEAEEEYQRYNLEQQRVELLKQNVEGESQYIYLQARSRVPPTAVYRVGIIGGGKIGCALMEHMLSLKLNIKISVSTRRPESANIQKLIKQGVIAYYDNIRLITDNHLIFVCCLPHQFSSFASLIRTLQHKPLTTQIFFCTMSHLATDFNKCLAPLKKQLQCDNVAKTHVLLPHVCVLNSDDAKRHMNEYIDSLLRVTKQQLLAQLCYSSMEKVIDEYIASSLPALENDLSPFFLSTTQQLIPFAQPPSSTLSSPVVHNSSIKATPLTVSKLNTRVESPSKPPLPLLHHRDTNQSPVERNTPTPLKGRMTRPLGTTSPSPSKLK